MGLMIGRHEMINNAPLNMTPTRIRWDNLRRLAKKRSLVC